MTTARIIDMDTGAVELREFSSAADARRSLAKEVGQLLIWEHQETRWTATTAHHEYQVDMDHIEPAEVAEEHPADPSTQPGT